MKLGVRETMILQWIERQGGTVTATQFNDALAGELRRSRALFRKGLVEADAVPARMVKLTGIGKLILRANLMPN